MAKAATPSVPMYVYDANTSIPGDLFRGRFPELVKNVCDFDYGMRRLLLLISIDVYKIVPEQGVTLQETHNVATVVTKDQDKVGFDRKSLEADTQIDYSRPEKDFDSHMMMQCANSLVSEAYRFAYEYKEMSAEVVPDFNSPIMTSYLKYVQYMVKDVYTERKVVLLQASVYLERGRNEDRTRRILHPLVKLIP